MCVGNTIKKLPTLLKTKQNKLKKSGKMDNRKRPTLRLYMYVRATVIATTTIITKIIKYFIMNYLQNIFVYSNKRKEKMFHLFIKIKNFSKSLI